MKICGIIAEYNPFHNGHLYQIEETRRMLGLDTAVVCCMSGDFVQRGEAAVMDKTRRAKAAVMSGADLVLSLPLRWSLSSAQGFADGAVHILGMAGAEHISFGVEDDDVEALSEIAGLIAEKSVIDGTLATMMGSGVSYARARERELYKRIKDRASLISTPNNILAVEYLRAVRQQGLDISPIAVKRTGASHDGDTPDGVIASASYIRQLARGGRLDEAAGFMPPQSLEQLRRAAHEGAAMLDLSRLDCAMTAVLKRCSIEQLSKLPDASEGLEHRLYDAIQAGVGLEDICGGAKTKRYAYSRIRRMLYCAFLGIEKKPAGSLPGYTRVLAFNDMGRQVLSAVEQREDFVFITKPAAAKRLPEEERVGFELEAAASAAYDLALPGYRDLPRGREWTCGPFYIR